VDLREIFQDQTISILGIAVLIPGLVFSRLAKQRPLPDAAVVELQHSERAIASVDLSQNVNYFIAKVVPKLGPIWVHWLPNTS
jgi:hypothetical protein